LLTLAIVSCDKDAPSQPDQPSGDQTSFAITLTYDSAANAITAIPADTTSDYVLFVWMVQDYIADYGNDFSDAQIYANMQSYISQCIMFEMSFPLFRGCETVDVYDFFDQPYPGNECIAMAAPYDTKSRKLLQPVAHLRFTTPQR